jgi:hypothetical protein
MPQYKCPPDARHGGRLQLRVRNLLCAQQLIVRGLGRRQLRQALAVGDCGTGVAEAQIRAHVALSVFRVES